MNEDKLGKELACVEGFQSFWAFSRWAALHVHVLRGKEAGHCGCFVACGDDTFLAAAGRARGTAA